MQRTLLANVLLLLASPAWADSGEVTEFTLDEVESAEAEGGEEMEFTGGALDKVRAGAIAKELKDIRWGMSRSEVLKVLKERIREQYEPRIRRSFDAVKQDALIQEANEAYRAIKRNFVNFNGRITGWDVSPMAPEFRHGTQEAMLVVDGDGSRDFYFFIDNRLWKYYRELEAETFRDLAYDDVAESFRRRFGRGDAGYGEREEGATPSRWVEWTEAGTKLTALERGAHYCLIFEDARTLQHLVLLRKDALPRGKKRNSTVDAILMSDSDRKKLHDEVDRRLSRKK